MKKYILFIRISLISIFILTLISCSKRKAGFSNQDTVDLNPEISVSDSIGKIYNYEVDSTILITDSEGNILGGDTNDWDLTNKNYTEIQKYIFMFQRPFFKNEPHPAVVGLEEPFSFEVYNNLVILKWFTSAEIDNKGFYVERTETNLNDRNDHWIELGFVKGYGNSDKERSYKFIDNKVKAGIKYKYRLKQVSLTNEIEYHQLPQEVLVINYPNHFEFYPAFPNPVIENVTFSFYVPKKDIVSLFFLNDNNKDTTYILDHERQERGYYKVTIDKESLGFDNETKRLYIDCESCDKKKNFGDVQF